MKLDLRRILVVAVAVAGAACAGADEGMWLFNNLPKAYLKEKYGFEPTDAWAEHVRLASVRFNSGGSGSFVSSTGLVLTNHHVGSDTLHKISDEKHDYYRDGFYARTLAEEKPAVDLELNVLASIADVTERVNGAVKTGMSPAEAFAARRAASALIEKESFDQTGLRSNVITLYQGGQYHLYSYKRYTDVRLVWAPEMAVAFFGGDPDNFEYPRYCLDACLFRVYEDGKPARIEHFLQWSESGAADGALVFVSGNPGSTNRLYTVAALRDLRDRQVPKFLGWLYRREVLLQQYSNESTEAARRAKEDLFGVQNSRKAVLGELQGLQDPALFAQKIEAENELRRRVQADPELKPYADAWDQIAEARKTAAGIAREVNLFEGAMGMRCQLFSIARMLVRLAEEDRKPNAERLPEFRDSARPSLEQRLFSAAPLYADLEATLLADSLAYLVEELGADDPEVRKILANKSPVARAAELVGGTRLFDVQERRRIAQLGPKGIGESTDPMIRLAALVDPRARTGRKTFEEKIQEVQTQAYGKIAKVLFAIHGPSQYPDATFTLRLSFGQVKGYTEAGKPIPPWTTLGGAFEHEKVHGAKDPWLLPKLWHERKEQLDVATPFNFVCTADIIGGNSGSPVINRKAELVGLIFDGNIHSLTADYVYTDTLNRAVSVHSSAIREALRKLYDAGPLADELGR